MFYNATKYSYEINFTNYQYKNLISKTGKEEINECVFVTTKIRGKDFVNITVHENTIIHQSFKIKITVYITYGG